eukprot:gnl/MRDRNA2_/MRDRNA2_332407_c0_seq1.p1 gnl/MRDRNA2_/MRDRNA2_332407_c0~~gnl/MRDRNA2_/MRDRNA2_332407_c0_seq1.p1  ORF type:complete len:277 (-),score=35.76 gnl/MRDRNA2_/MRDRNA2_332407_c0_seq1:17-778(-)
MAALAEYNGKSRQECYFSAGGVIWDVSTSESFAQKGPYSCFAGRDSTLPLVHMQLDARMANRSDKWKEMTEKDHQSLSSWMRYFDEKYRRVGVLREWVRGEEYTDTQQRFLEENGKKLGVATLPSGLQFETLHPALEGAKAVETDKTLVELHFVGRRSDGLVFSDSRSNDGARLRLTPNDMIPGCKEALRLMKEGERRLLYIPAALAYGSKGCEPFIPPGSALVFDVEVFRVVGETPDSSIRRPVMGSQRTFK